MTEETPFQREVRERREEYELMGLVYRAACGREVPAAIQARHEGAAYRLLARARQEDWDVHLRAGAEALGIDLKSAAPPADDESTTTRSPTP